MPHIPLQKTFEAFKERSPANTHFAARAIVKRKNLGMATGFVSLFYSISPRFSRCSRIPLCVCVGKHDFERMALCVCHFSNLRQWTKTCQNRSFYAMTFKRYFYFKVVQCNAMCEYPYRYRMRYVWSTHGLLFFALQQRHLCQKHGNFRSSYILSASTQPELFGLLSCTKGIKFGALRNH